MKMLGFFLSLILPIGAQGNPTNEYLIEKFNLNVGMYLLPAKDKIPIKNWTNPSIEDYKTIQNYLANASRPELQYLNFPGSHSRERQIRNFKIITESKNPEFHIKIYNNDPNNKKNCIVTYISMNDSYIKCLNDMIHQLNRIGFDGHLIYRIGGWPDTEENSLELFDVPYAFKIFSIMEAKKMGYKNCLWLDACFCPLKPLDPIFEHIDQYGVFFHASSIYDSRDNIQEFATLALGNISLAEFLKLSAVSTTILGLDLTSDLGKEILANWLAMAKNKLGFLSFIPEMAPWYILVDRFHLLSFADHNFISYCSNDVSDLSLLYWNHANISRRD